MTGREISNSQNMEERTWVRDCLHVLRDYAQIKELYEADDAIRAAIVRVSLEAGVPTMLSVRDLVAYQLSEQAANALDTCADAD